MGCYISTALILLQMIINLYGARLTSHSNIVAVIAEIVGIVGLGCLIVTAVMHKGHFHYNLLTTIPAEPRPYWSGFLMCSLLGAWTIGGFESSADVSEETVNAAVVTPKAIVCSVVASAALGFVFIVIMTLAIPNLAEVSRASYPLAAITSYYLGVGMTNLFMASALVAMFSCSMVCMTAGSRSLFAMARDGRFIAAPLFSKTSAHKVPKAAILMVTFLGIVFSFMTENATSLYGASTVLSAIYYLITVVAFAIGIGKLSKSGTFSLGRWHWLVSVLAAGWMIVEILVLTFPRVFHPVAEATGSVLAVGLIVYLISGRAHRATDGDAKPSASP
jgi:amino acid transporter